MRSEGKVASAPFALLGAFAAACLAACGSPAPGAAPASATLRVAAAANLAALGPAIAAGFKAQALAAGVDVRVDLSFAPSGALAAQILAGAPYHLFLSADEDQPAKVAAAGLARGAPRAYATGKLVVVGALPKKTGTDYADLAVLAGPAFERIAIADPATAPYGVASIEALKSSGALVAVQGKLLLAQGVAQALQFYSAGADACFVSPSALPAGLPGGRAVGAGEWAFVDPAAYAPIVQAMALLSSDQPAALLWDFLLGGEGQAIFAAWGYGKPPDPEVVD